MDVEVVKQQQRRMWSVGDFPDVARTIEPASRAVLEAVGVQDGQRLLDVATGTGNLAIPAALGGAHVTGLDLTPELFEFARARAAEAGVVVGRAPGRHVAARHTGDATGRPGACRFARAHLRQSRRPEGAVRRRHPGGRDAPRAGRLRARPA